MKPLVSIVMPAYNAEKWIAESLQSAVTQTWPRKEIIVVDDGSTDRTAEVARQFASKNVAVFSTDNRGLSAAVNHGIHRCQGDYIQELDSDDLLAPDKIEKQLEALQKIESKRILASSPWGHFYYRTRHTRFIQNSLWQDLSPVEWLLRKMGEDLHMQNATWLVSRELTETAGPWNEGLQYDQDGEYYARVVRASEGIRFVSEGRIYYRVSGSNQLSYIGASNRKKDSLFRSMKLHIQYLRSLEESDRVRKACVTYMQTWYPHFYPDRPDIVAELQDLAAELQGHLQPPRFDWKYEWLKPVFGWRAAATAERFFAGLKTSLIRRWDNAMYRLETRANYLVTPTAVNLKQRD